MNKNKMRSIASICTAGLGMFIGLYYATKPLKNEDFGTAMLRCGYLTAIADIFTVGFIVGSFKVLAVNPRINE